MLLKFVNLLPTLPYTAPGAPALSEEVGNWEKFQVSGDSFQVLYIISTWGKFDGKPLTTPMSTKKRRQYRWLREWVLGSDKLHFLFLLQVHIISCLGFYLPHQTICICVWLFTTDSVSHLQSISHNAHNSSLR